MKKIKKKSRKKSKKNQNKNQKSTQLKSDQTHDHCLSAQHKTKHTKRGVAGRVLAGAEHAVPELSAGRNYELEDLDRSARH
jgi:hypothetical protein